MGFEKQREEIRRKERIHANRWHNYYNNPPDPKTCVICREYHRQLHKLSILETKINHNRRQLK